MLSAGWLRMIIDGFENDFGLCLLLTRRVEYELCASPKGGIAPFVSPPTLRRCVHRAALDALGQHRSRLSLAVCPRLTSVPYSSEGAWTPRELRPAPFLGLDVSKNRTILVHMKCAKRNSLLVCETCRHMKILSRTPMAASRPNPKIL